MYLTDNIELISKILEQLSVDAERSSEDLKGDQEQILFGLREMIRLNLISGACHYSEYSARFYRAYLQFALPREGSR